MQHKAATEQHAIYHPGSRL